MTSWTAPAKSSFGCSVSRTKVLQGLLLLHVGAVLAAAASSQLNACSSIEGGIWLLGWCLLSKQLVPCSRVGELPDRLQDYRTTANYLRLQSWQTQHIWVVKSEVRRNVARRNGTLKYRQSTPGLGWLPFICLLQYILYCWYNLKFCCSWYT